MQYTTQKINTNTASCCVAAHYFIMPPLGRWPFTPAKYGTKVLQLQVVCDFGDENYLQVMKLKRSTKLQINTEPAIFYRYY